MSMINLREESWTVVGYSRDDKDEVTIEIEGESGTHSMDVLVRVGVDLLIGIDDEDFKILGIDYFDEYGRCDDFEFDKDSINDLIVEQLSEVDWSDYCGWD